MNELFPAAERIARADGIDQPGAEHLLLAAFDLDDGIVRGAFEAFGVDGPALRAAVAGQHEEALRAIGVVADDNAIDAALPGRDAPRGVYRSQGSMQTAFRRAVDLAKGEKVPLDGGHLLRATTEGDRGTVARTLEHLGVDRELLRERVRRGVGT